MNRAAIWQEVVEEYIGGPAGRTREIDVRLESIEERAVFRPLVQQLAAE